jgi:hypothetical protein
MLLLLLLLLPLTHPAAAAAVAAAAPAAESRSPRAPLLNPATTLLLLLLNPPKTCSRGWLAKPKGLVHLEWGVDIVVSNAPAFALLTNPAVLLTNPAALLTTPPPPTGLKARLLLALLPVLPPPATAAAAAAAAGDPGRARSPVLLSSTTISQLVNISVYQNSIKHGSLTEPSTLCICWCGIAASAAAGSSDAGGAAAGNAAAGNTAATGHAAAVLQGCERLWVLLQHTPAVATRESRAQAGQQHALLLLLLLLLLVMGSAAPCAAAAAAAAVLLPWHNDAQHSTAQHSTAQRTRSRAQHSTHARQYDRHWQAGMKSYTSCRTACVCKPLTLQPAWFASRCVGALVLCLQAAGGVHTLAEEWFPAASVQTLVPHLCTKSLLGLCDLLCFKMRALVEQLLPPPSLPPSLAPARLSAPNHGMHSPSCC